MESFETGLVTLSPRQQLGGNWGEKDVLSFHLLGHRGYVHGPCMLEGMLRSLDRFLPAGLTLPARINSFKVIREFYTQAYVECLETSETQQYKGLKNAVASLDIIISDKSFKVLLFDLPGRPVTHRLSSWTPADFVREIYLEKGGAARAVVKNLRNSVDLITAIVEAYRQILLNEPDTDTSFLKMRWGYITNFPLFTAKAASQVIDVYFGPKKIILTNPKTQFILKQFRVDQSPDGLTSEMCFYRQLG
jgi:hypothetical protein